jgi:thiamine transport system ATP-binding protein
MLRLKAWNLRLGDFTPVDGCAGARGERVAVLGASGSGKSTLLSLLAGFVVPERGRITWEGRDITALGPAERPMSILFQDGNLFPHLTVAQNVGLALRSDLRLTRRRMRGSRRRWIGWGSTGMGGRRPADLSGGQQGRAALARLLLQERPVALLDEPLAALDPGLRTEMLRLLVSLWEARGLTYVMATHDLRDAERLCDPGLAAGGGARGAGPARRGIAEDAPEVLRDWF